jgi:6-phosphogluconolactonase
MNKPACKIFATAKDLAEACAQEVAELIRKRTSGKGDSRVTIALSGGTTPNLLFKELAGKYKNDINWSQVDFYWADERCVPPDDPESNYGVARELLFKKAEIQQNNIRRIKGEEEPASEAQRYSEEIFNNVQKKNGLPAFDLVLLGVGDDGHTASIFPDNMDLLKSRLICDVVLHPVSGQKRITLTGSVLNNAVSVRFLVAGMNKAKVLYEIINKTDVSREYPAAFIEPSSGDMLWMLDADAGSMVEETTGV